MKRPVLKRRAFHNIIISTGRLYACGRVRKSSRYARNSPVQKRERLLETWRNPAIKHAGNHGRPKLCQFAVGVTAMDAVRTAFAKEQELPARIAFLRAVVGVTTL